MSSDWIFNKFKSNYETVEVICLKCQSTQDFDFHYFAKENGEFLCTVCFSNNSIKVISPLYDIKEHGIQVYRTLCKCGVMMDLCDFKISKHKFCVHYKFCYRCDIILTESNAYNKNKGGYCTVCHKIKRKENYQKDPKKAIKTNNKWQKHKRQTDPVFRAAASIRQRLYQYVKSKNMSKVTSFTKAIGCTQVQFREYIESKFTSGMSWDNYGEWHIDHIVPMCAGKTVDDLYKLSHFSNLQPLWAADNLKKGGKIPTEAYLNQLGFKFSKTRSYYKIKEKKKKRLG